MLQFFNRVVKAYEACIIIKGFCKNKLTEEFINDLINEAQEQSEVDDIQIPDEVKNTFYNVISSPDNYKDRGLSDEDVTLISSTIKNKLGL